MRTRSAPNCTQIEDNFKTTHYLEVPLYYPQGSPADELASIVRQPVWERLHAHETTNITYSFDLPTDPKKLNAFIAVQPDYIRDENPTFFDMGEHRQLIRNAFSWWEKLANIKFREVDTKGQLPIFKFHIGNSSPRGYANYPAIFVENRTTIVHASKGIGFNVDIFAPNQPLPAEAWKTMLHELAHGLCLQHRFAFVRDNNLWNNSTAYSVTNYDYTNMTMGKNTFKIVPVTPMVFDIEAVQNIYGANKDIGMLDDTYDLFEVAYNQTRDLKSSAITTGTFPYDNSGRDTLDASRLQHDVILNLRPYSHSKLIMSKNKTHILEMPNIAIEDVVTGPKRTLLILNDRNNAVNVTQAKSAYIMVDPHRCGHDTIFGFHPNRTFLKLERLPSDYERFQIIDVNETANFSAPANNATVESHHQVVMQFDQDNSVTLVDVKKSELTKNNIIFSPNEDVVTCKLITSDFTSHVTPMTTNTSHVEPSITSFNRSAINGTAVNDTDINAAECSSQNDATPAAINDQQVHVPADLLQSALTSLLLGVGITLAMKQLAEELRKLDYAESDIKITTMAVQAALILVTGSFLSSGASFLTNFTLNYFGFSNKTCLLASNAVGISVSAINKFSLFGVASGVVAVAGGFAGSYFANWMHEKSPVVSDSKHSSCPR